MRSLNLRLKYNFILLPARVFVKLKTRCHISSDLKFKRESISSSSWKVAKEINHQSYTEPDKAINQTAFSAMQEKGIKCGGP
jgi:hypothetical protein